MVPSYPTFLVFFFFEPHELSRLTLYPPSSATQAASLHLLSRAPILHFTHTYDPLNAPLFPTLTVETLIHLLAVYLPLRFLRAGSASSSSSSSSRRGPAFDFPRITQSLFAASIYQLALHVASEKFLTDWLLRCGWEMEQWGATKIGYAPETLNFTRTGLMLPVGWAMTEILGYRSDKEEALEARARSGARAGDAEEEEDVVGGLLSFFARSWMKLRPETRRVVRRTALVAVYQAFGATSGASQLKSGNLVGALGMGGVWAVATLLVGPALGWVERT